MPGTLFVVATPIGNLEDLTLRALRVLREVSVIAAEDTRRTAKLLAHYEIRTPMTSLHEHNEARAAAGLIERLRAGESVALVSDAGTPGISDPGHLFVRLARAAGVPVTAVPGPSAITAALSISGLALESGFVFAGFPASSGQQRADWLEDIANEARVVVAFESPHRIRRTVADLKHKFAERPIIVIREISKIYETLVIQTIDGDKHNSLPEQGEFVVIVGAAKDEDRAEVDAAAASKIFGLLTEQLGVSDTMALAGAAGALGVEPKDVRKALKKARIRADRERQQSS